MSDVDPLKKTIPSLNSKVNDEEQVFIDIDKKSDEYLKKRFRQIIGYEKTIDGKSNFIESEMTRSDRITERTVSFLIVLFSMTLHNLVTISL